MLKVITKIMAGYGWSDPSEFMLSIFPSLKYHITFGMVVLSSLMVSLEMFLGLSHATLVAFAVLALAELISGLTASVVVKKQRLESGKMGRFTFKLAMLMIVIYVVNTFRLQFLDNAPILHGLFDWMYSGIFAYTALEYLVSVLENVSVITGKESSSLINAIKEKLSNLLKL
ncbi:MAG: phage holin family protein [Flavobacteriales bacterium]